MNKKNYYIITIGCQMNKSDSERIASYLENLGYTKAESRKEAGLVILTTCGVRQSAEDRIYGLIPKIKKENGNAKICLTGCLSERKDVIKRMEDRVDYWLPIKDLPKFAEKLGETGDMKFYKDYLNVKPKYFSKISAFVPIGNGCDNFCTYCVVPYARGREVYRPVEEILNEVRDLVEKGYKEIILIAQNVNSYKSNFEYLKNKNEISFANLLQILNGIPGDFWIRFATSHPKDMSDELIEVISQCKKVCEHVHLPAQTGNNEVLKNMNRNYTIERYKGLINKIKSELKFKKLEFKTQKSGEYNPEVAISTDIIVGFPGETKEQFEDTVKLFEYVEFDMAYVARYSPRPGTAAKRLKDNVSPEEKQRREEVLMNILKRTAFKNSQKFMGMEVEVLVEGVNKKGELYGKTRTNKNVKIKNGDESLVGEFVAVKIDKGQEFRIAGNII